MNSTAPKRTNYHKPTTVCLLLLALTGCATLSGTPKSLTERAADRWDAILTGDHERAYSYLSPTYRSVVSQEEYSKILSNRTVKWTAARVAPFDECPQTAEACDVPVQIDYEVRRGLPGVKTPVGLSHNATEDWINVDGAWYFVPDRIR